VNTSIFRNISNDNIVRCAAMSFESNASNAIGPFGCFVIYC